MADRGLSITNPLMASMGAGLRVPAARFGDDPATRTGLGSIQPTDMDAAVSGRAVMPDAPEAVSRLDAFRARGAARTQELFNTPVRAPQTAASSPATVYFNQSTNEMFAGDQAFKADDTQSALEAAAKPANTTRPQGQGWTSLPEGSFDRYLSSFSERRSTGELLGRGTKQIAYGLTALPGSLLTLAGAESIGEPMRQAAQDVFGESENEQLRSYLISQRSSFGEKVTDTVIEAVPMLFSAVFGGWAASALGAASKTGAVASAARTLGPRGGAAITTMPIHMTSFFDAAERNGMDVTDPEVRVGIVGGTLFNTTLDMFGAGGAAGRLGSLLSPTARKALQQASSTTSRNLLRRASVEGGKTAAGEAVTETMQTFMEMALFDPIVRENMSPSDWKFLVPHMSENYKENLQLAGVSGALLGFGAGATVGAFSGPGPKPPIPTNKPLDLNTTATEQSAEKEAPELGYTEPSEAMFGTTDLTRLPPTAQDYVSQPGLDYTSNIPAGMGSLLRNVPRTPVAQTEQPADTLGYTEPSGGVFGTTDLTGLVPRAPEPAAQPAFDYTADIPAGMGSPLRDVPRSQATTEQAPLIAQRRTGVSAPGDQRLRTRPSMRPEEEVATGTVEPTEPSPFGEQLLRALAQRQQPAVQPAFDETATDVPAAEPVVETVVDPNEITPREYRAVYATWAQVKAQQPNPDIFPDFDRLRKNAQWDWVDAVRNEEFLLSDGSVDIDFFQNLAKRTQDKKVPLVETGVSRRATSPSKADADFLRRRTEQLRAREALGQGVQVQSSRLNKLSERLNTQRDRIIDEGEAELARRRQPAAPAPAALPEGVFGTKDGKPFKNKPAANGAKSSVAKREGVAATTLTVVEVPGGFGLRVTSPPTQGTTGTQGTQESRVRKGAAPTPQPKPKGPTAQAAPAPESEVQAPVKATEATQPKQTLAERVNALDEDDAFRLQELIDPTGDLDLDTAVETKPKRVEAALRRIATPDEGVDAAATKLATLADTNPDVTTLSGMIAEFNANPAVGLAETWGSRFRQAAATVKEKAAKARFGDQTLLSYVGENNNPNFQTVDGKRQIVSSEATGRNALSDFNTIDGVVDLNGKTVLPLAPGRVDLLVRNFVRKLKRAPTITVVRNQADLKAKNPALYRKAVAARPQGDFDTANAIGYSFGDGQVVVFTDRIGSEQQLNFVLAHESLGHYGLRAIMPADKFDSTMEQVYKSDPLIANAVDQAVEARGMSRSEATEEYLADYAAVLDMSLLRRVAAAMKDALNAVGFKFSDDMVRHLLRTSRRYVRNGKRENLFTSSDLFRDIQAIESGTDQLDTGRFKVGFTSDSIRTDTVSYDVYGSVPRTMEEVSAALAPAKEKLSAGTEAAIRKFFSLTTFNALDNPGLSRLMSIIQRGSEIATKVRNTADEIMRFALDREVRFAGIRIMGGITELEQLAASRLNYGQQDAVRGTVEAKLEKTLKDLRDKKISTRMFNIVDGLPQENEKAIAAYVSAGRLTLADAKVLLAKDKRYKAIADDLTKDHVAWKAYEASREAFEMGEIEFVKSQYSALSADRDNATQSLLDLLPDPPGDADKVLPSYAPAMFKTWTDVYYALYSKDATTIEDNLIPTDRGGRQAGEFSRAVNEALIAEGYDTAKEDAIRNFFTGKEADDFIAQVVAFRKLVVVNEDNKFVVQNKVAEFGAAELAFSSAELSSRKMLVQGYTPINRAELGFQIRTQAYDAQTGEILQMHNEYRDRAMFRMVGTAEEGTKTAAMLQQAFSDTDLPAGSPSDIVIKTITDKNGNPVKVRAYKVLTRKEGESDFKMREVVIRFDVSAAATGVSTPLSLNLNEFLRGLRQYGLNIQPAKLEQIVVDMTAQDARARKRLEQTGNPGYEIQGGITALEAIARHIDTRAALIAKIQMRPKLDRLMNTKLSDSRKLWFGDKKKLSDLEKAYNTAVSSGADESTVFLAKKEYDRYKYQMGKTNATVNGVNVNLGNKFLSEGHSLLTFVNGNRDVNESDWGSGPVASFMRRWISSVQLGGTLTQPIMNNIGPFTNFIPWLGSFNEKNGFGGGAGFKNAYAQYLRAMSDVGGGGGVSFSKRALEMHTAEYWDQVATGLVVHDGVNKAEAEFIAAETSNGILTPAQANSLLGTARNYTTNPAIRQALDKWMFFYLSSEQATRRSAALAAFRVEFERQAARKGLTAEQLSKPENKAEYKKIHAAATEFAAEGVRMTLGEYGVFNRPAAWRSGLQSFLYMYRVWPTTSIQTLKRLDWRGRAAMVIPLLAMSGVAGLPFAEDGEDVADTILQRLGLPVGSVRLEAAKLIDEVLPGMAPYILNGPMSALLGTDVAGRFSMGDFVPGTAGFLPGQAPLETFKDIVGPAWGFLEGTAKGGAQAVAAPFSDTATFAGAMREGPITLLRALGDAYAYTAAGAAVDKRGYVIDPDLTTSMLAIRVLGFTPAAIAADYEVIRLAKRETNYQKQVVAKFRTGLLKAEMAGDRETAASIRRTVKEWNEATDGTLLEIKNFEKNYQRLRKLALMPARQRFIQSAGKANQDAIEFIGELSSYD